MVRPDRVQYNRPVIDLSLLKMYRRSLAQQHRIADAFLDHNVTIEAIHQNSV